MKIEVTPEAVEVLKRSLQLAGLSDSSTGIRLRTAHGLGGGTQVQIEFATEPQPDEETVDADGIRLFMSPDVVAAVPDPVLTVEPQHERVVLRPRND